MTSIRSFLVIVILSVVCLSNFIAALHGYKDSLRAVDRIEEQQLLEKAHTLKTVFEHQPDIPANVFNGDTLFQIWEQEKLLDRSENSPETVFYPAGNGFHLKNYAGQQWLLYGLSMPESGLYIVVAEKHRAYSSLTEDVLIKAILPIIWILPVIGILVWIVVNIGTKPLKQLAAQLSAKKANDFSPVGSGQYAKELQPIIAALNGLFSRLSEAFERERRFSADAAHELRTPLSALKINLHNISGEQKNSDTWRALKRTADRMEHSIGQLLALHRVSMDVDDGDPASCELYGVAEDVIAEVYDELERKQQTVELLGSEAWIRGNATSMAILIRNLVENASKYTPEHGVIRVTIHRDNRRAGILVEDSGPGIPEQEYSRVLERFYRVGGDRNDSTVTGSGLGLSIVSHIVRIYEGRIHLSCSTALGGLSVEVTFASVNGGSKDDALV